MRIIILIIFTLTMSICFSQKLDIISLDKFETSVIVLDSISTSNMLTQFEGKQDNSIRKKWTSRTFKLSNEKILIEFYDKQSVLIGSLEDFNKLDNIRFVKNTIGFLKKNISYKIELTFDEGIEIIEKEKPKRLTQYVSDLPEWNDFEVYKLNTGQILYLDKSKNQKTASIFPDIKTLASENTSILEQEYYSDEEEYLMKVLASGDRLLDYEPQYHSIYPKYLKDLVKNHNLSLIEEKIYVSDFFSNLYKSENGYYILVEEVNQKNGAGNKKLILDLRIYNDIEQLRMDQKRFSEYSESPFAWEHLYQQISDKYGQKFPDLVFQLIAKLPQSLNFDNEQLSFDSNGIDLVDEALKWNGTSEKKFNEWFPSILAYYGQCYITEFKDGEWKTIYDKEDKLWIPEVILKNGDSAWDYTNFYKSLYEGPVPMRWAGNWNH